MAASIDENVNFEERNTQLISSKKGTPRIILHRVEQQMLSSMAEESKRYQHSNSAIPIEDGEYEDLSHMS